MGTTIANSMSYEVLQCPHNIPSDLLRTPKRCHRLPVSADTDGGRHGWVS